MSHNIINYPSLIYGTAWKKERTAELVEKAVMYGFRGIDTACQPKHYNEAGVGHALSCLKAQGITRDSLYIQTKFTPLSGQDPAKVPYNPSSSIQEQVHESFKTSLKNLKVDYLDALLLHSPYSYHKETMEAWHAMEALHRQGLVHKLGISNCYDLKAFKLIFNEATVKPSFLQNRFYAETDYDKSLRKYCNETNIRYQSFWTLTANPHILSHPLICNLALSRQVTAEQLFFRFLTQQQIIPLIGTCSDKHMQEDLAIFQFMLMDDEISKINDQLSNGL
jgi:diketogulonate reductase-like aldo/keto reductase